MQPDTNFVVSEVNEWFASILKLTEGSLFAIAPEGPHRDAVVLDVLRRNARILFATELDNEGKLYSPLGFYLAAACRKIGVVLNRDHWRSALNNVVQLEGQITNSHELSDLVGLTIGSPAALFKQEFDEAIGQAGLAGPPSYLDKGERQVAIGLSINWGIRLLLSYAAECEPSVGDTNRKDFNWLVHLIQRLVTGAK